MAGPEAAAAPVLGYPEKFELALRYGEAVLAEAQLLSDSDKLLLDALSKQATLGVCTEPRPSMWDAVAKARWNAWKELGNRSKFEAMFMYVQAVEELAPDWWKWPPLGLAPASEDSAADTDATTSTDAVNAADGATTDTAGSDAADGNGSTDGEVFSPGDEIRISPAVKAAAKPAATAASAAATTTATASCNGGASIGGTPPHPDRGSPLHTVALDRWSALQGDGAPARYRHGCAMVGARLFVFGGRCSSGRLAARLWVYDLLSGGWTTPTPSGDEPQLRWGHSMNAFRQWVVLFGGHRRRGCLNDVACLDTESLAWSAPPIRGELPPPRGNHSAVVVGTRLWVFGGDAPLSSMLPQSVWSLPLQRDPHAADGGDGGGGGGDGAAGVSWDMSQTSGSAPPPCCDHTAVACGQRVMLLGGSSGMGYMPLSQLYVFDTLTGAWASVKTEGSLPSARAGHVAAVQQAAGGGFRVYLFGGGNSATGFNDLNVLEPNLSWRNVMPNGGPEAEMSTPLATEGATAVLSGGLLLVFGGYTAAGATSNCYAWRCEATATASAKLSPRGESSAAGGPPASAQRLLVVACPPTAPADAFATSAAEALAPVYENVQVVGAHVPLDAESAEPALNGDAKVASLHADSSEQAVSLVVQRLRQLLLQQHVFGAESGSLLGCASLLAAVQPCTYVLSTAGAVRTFSTCWIGLLDVGTGKEAVAACATREIEPAHPSAPFSAELDADGAEQLAQAWTWVAKRISS